MKDSAQDDKASKEKPSVRHVTIKPPPWSGSIRPGDRLTGITNPLLDKMRAERLAREQGQK